MSDEIQKMLNDHFIKNHPNVPEYARPNKKSKKSPANQLTSDIIKHIALVGGWATRINTMGRVVDGKYIPGSTKLGTPDIIACIKSRFIGIEIKIGKDKISAVQEDTHCSIQKALGILLVIHNLDEWLDAYKTWCE